MGLFFRNIQILTFFTFVSPSPPISKLPTMKIFESFHTFNYNWQHVSAANWSKYPNDTCKHVVAVDILDRYIDPETGVLVTERLITCRQSVPKWIIKMVGGTEDSYVREVSQVDPRNQTLCMRSVNLTLSNILSIQETVKYCPNPVSPATQTLFQQDARITAYGALTRICTAIEDWSIERFKQNASKGREGLETILQKKLSRDLLRREQS
ncbi:Protein UPS2, mitochondrial [Neolecta irregularis DAH-3]|uniref:Protein UPS2, mitochondrial n=1 Tax=Neolecta irregularis (strain DAH-3) TaxID=1198029 RepID=A0A1U7LI38_NEOID|nr:Protein UPS2, mitochondrial [Neolecta irregularis DAH-3]|eukprot:OLL22309.1 Protein UPS2, mitochondrial [Neolecta irregularis DAH-3]